MANATTQLADLINPEVMGDMISYELVDKLQATRFFKVDKTLEGRAGNTITIPRYKYIGMAKKYGENTAIDADKLETEDVDYTVEKACKSIELTDEAVLSGHGDPVGQANSQLRLSIQDRIEQDAVELVNSLTSSDGVAYYDDEKTSNLSYDSIIDAMDLLNIEEQGTDLYILVGKAGIKQLRKDTKYIDATSYAGNSVMSTGVVGTIAGCKVVVSNRIDKLQADGATTSKAFIFKPELWTAFMKRDINLETERNVQYKKTLISSDCHYVVAIEDLTKMVILEHKK